MFKHCSIDHSLFILSLLNNISRSVSFCASKLSKSFVANNILFFNSIFLSSLPLLLAKNSPSTKFFIQASFAKTCLYNNRGHLNISKLANKDIHQTTI